LTPFSPDLIQGELWVQGIVFVIQKSAVWEPTLLDVLSQQWGPILHKGELYTFDTGSYYHPEMGSPLYRGVLGFSKLWPASQLPLYKIQATQIEQNLAQCRQKHNNATDNEPLFAVDNKPKTNEVVNRNYNLDPGYLDFDKCILASFKRSGPKIFLGQGVWGDMLLHYAKGHFEPFPWAFADFKDKRYEKDLLRLRELYKKMLGKFKT